jgi:hypothetical protein
MVPWILLYPGSTVLDIDLYLYFQLEKIQSDMESIYSTAKVCQHKNEKNCNLTLEPGNNPVDGFHQPSFWSLIANNPVKPIQIKCGT